jgi:hypothetical protein
LAEQQRSNAALTAARIREAKVLPIYGSQAAIVGERQRIEADLGPVRYLAKFTGARSDDHAVVHSGGFLAARSGSRPTASRRQCSAVISHRGSDTSDRERVIAAHLELQTS